MTGPEWVAVIGSCAGLATAIGAVVVKVVSLKLQYARELARGELAAVARAAATGRPAVAELLEGFDKTGTFTRPTFPDESGGG